MAFISNRVQSYRLSTGAVNPQRDANVQFIFIAKQSSLIQSKGMSDHSKTRDVWNEPEESGAGAKVSGAFVILMFHCVQE